ncbi:MAG TPA: hypothetical protein VM012_14580 [Flavitalea sp.]|nr:hypothetical protein [Flavitalea sp.]
MRDCLKWHYESAGQLYTCRFKDRVELSQPIAGNYTYRQVMKLEVLWKRAKGGSKEIGLGGCKRERKNWNI